MDLSAFRISDPGCECKSERVISLTRANNAACGKPDLEPGTRENVLAVLSGAYCQLTGYGITALITERGLQ